jgi:large subunit ribosomal protein L29
MKASKIREMNSDEMQEKLSSLEEELFNLRFQHGIGQLENPKKMLHIRRDIARFKTMLNEIARESK